MTDPKAVAHQSFRLIESGDVELAEQIIATGFVNEEADDDPDTEVALRQGDREE